MSTTDNAGRVAVITGASSGIGEATARDTLAAAARRVQDELGPAHALVKNAGVMLLAPFGPDQREDYRRMIEALSRPRHNEILVRPSAQA